MTGRMPPCTDPNEPCLWDDESDSCPCEDPEPEPDPPTYTDVIRDLADWSPEP